MCALKLVAVGRVLIKPLISLGLEVFELVYFGHGLGNTHSVFLIKQKELLLVVGVDGLDLIHERVE